MDPILDDLLGWYRRLSKHSFAYRNIIGQAEDEDVSEFVTGVGGSGAVGQCILTLDSGSLKLIPYKGNQVYFPDGTTAEISSSGVTLAATGLSVDTNYYIYATKSGTAVNALEASTTARATDSTTGIEIKNGDSTRVLVGLVRVVTGPAFVDDRERRYVRSWFNDQGVYLQGDNNSAATSSTSFVETDSTQRAQFLCWTNEPVDIAFAGAHSNNTAGSGASTSIGIDSSTSAVNISGVELQAIDYSNAANDLHSFCVRWCTTLSEGHHFVAGLIKAVTSGQASHNHGSISVHLAGAP